MVDGRFLGDLFWQVAGSTHTLEFTYMLMYRDSWKVVGTVLIHVNYSAHTREFTYMLMYRDSWKVGGQCSYT